MRVIDRLFEYLKYHNLTPYNLEKACGIANGYLKKQLRSDKGTIGLEILEKVNYRYRDLSLIWLVTGKGTMLTDDYAPQNLKVEEEQLNYASAEQIIIQLRDKIEILEKSLADKDKIIRLLEARVHS